MFGVIGRGLLGVLGRTDAVGGEKLIAADFKAPFALLLMDIDRACIGLLTSRLPVEFVSLSSLSSLIASQATLGRELETIVDDFD